MLLHNKIIISFIFFFLQAIFSSKSAPVPIPWPYQFHSLIFMNDTKGVLQMLDLWYDWPNGKNFQLIQDQLGKKLYNMQWNNGTTFYYTLDNHKQCKVANYGVGLLRPNWLDGATYLGQKYKDGFLCNVWTKLDFIWYYEDVVTKIPVYWAFYTGLVAHVITFEAGKVFDVGNEQAPVYCFKEEVEEEEEIRPSFEALARPTIYENFFRGIIDASIGV